MGILSEPSAKFELRPLPGFLQVWSSMQYVVVILFVCLFPVFVANFPSDWWVARALAAAGGVGILAGAGVFTWVLYVVPLVMAEERHTFWVWLALALLIGSYVLLVCCFLGLQGLVVRSHFSRGTRNHLWGIDKAKEGYEYTVWLLRQRLPREQRYWREWVATRDPAFLVHAPPEALVAHIYPLRFLLTMGMCVYLILIFVLFTIWLWSNIDAVATELYNQVPRPPNISWEEEKAANLQLLVGLKEAIVKLVMVAPQFSFLHRAVWVLEDFNYISTLRSINAWAAAFKSAVTRAGALAAVTALLGTMFCAWRLTKRVRLNILLIRKGKHRTDIPLELFSHRQAEQYPAQQLFHVLFGYLAQVPPDPFRGCWSPSANGWQTKR